jgi:hypothetical protein
VRPGFQDGGLIHASADGSTRNGLYTCLHAECRNAILDAAGALFGRREFGSGTPQDLYRCAKVVKNKLGYCIEVDGAPVSADLNDQKCSRQDGDVWKIPGKVNLRMLFRITPCPDLDDSLAKHRVTAC